MRILISGATGLIGSALWQHLRRGAHTLIRLTRAPRSTGEPEILWDPQQGRLEGEALENLDAVVHLAGENIAGRWTAEKKKRIRESRVQGTSLLARTLAQLTRPPSVLVCASATGFYGDRGDEPLDEESPGGPGFLASVCRDWEAAADPARERGIRVVHTRFGIVLSREGGALPRMLFPFRLGLGGVIGKGDQYWSWIHINDVVRAIEHALHHDGLEGPVNVTSPQPVTNREFTRTLGQILHRPTLFATPAWTLRWLLGEMADELLLSSARVHPTRLLATGFTFLFPDLEAALRDLL